MTISQANNGDTFGTVRGIINSCVDGNNQHLDELVGTRTDSITQRTFQKYWSQFRIGDDQAWNAQLPDNTVIIRSELSFHVEDASNYFMGTGLFWIAFQEADPDATWFPTGGWDEAWNWWGGQVTGNWNFFSTTEEKYPFTGTSGTDNNLNINAYRDGSLAYLTIENRWGHPGTFLLETTCLIQV